MASTSCAIEPSCEPFTTLPHDEPRRTTTRHLQRPNPRKKKWALAHPATRNSKEYLADAPPPALGPPLWNSPSQPTAPLYVRPRQMSIARRTYAGQRMADSAVSSQCWPSRNGPSKSRHDLHFIPVLISVQFKSKQRCTAPRPAVSVAAASTKGEPRRVDCLRGCDNRNRAHAPCRRGGTTRP